MLLVLGAQDHIIDTHRHSLAISRVILRMYICYKSLIVFQRLILSGTL